MNCMRDASGFYSTRSRVQDFKGFEDTGFFKDQRSGVRAWGLGSRVQGLGVNRLGVNPKP